MKTGKKLFQKMIFLHVYYSDFSDLWKFMFHMVV